MSYFLAGLPGKLKVLTDRLTAPRAANLDNLDATISSRPAAADYTPTRAAKLDNLDAAISSITNYPAGITGNIKLFPVIKTASGTLLSKVAKASSNTDTFSSFFSGFKANIATANTASAWQTVCDVTGSGLFAHAVGPAGGAGITSQQMRITLDGVAHTISVTPVVGSRIVFGSVMLGEPFITANTYGATGPGGYYDTGGAVGLQNADDTFTASGSTNEPVFLPSVLALLTAGLPLLRFETSLKVETWVDSGSTTNAEEYAGVAYIDDVL